MTSALILLMRLHSHDVVVERDVPALGQEPWQCEEPASEAVAGVDVVGYRSRR